MPVLWNDRPGTNQCAPLLREMWPGKVRTSRIRTRAIVASQRLCGPCGRHLSTTSHRLYVAGGIPDRETHQAKRGLAGPPLLGRAPPSGEYQRHWRSPRTHRALQARLDLRCRTPAVRSGDPASGTSGSVCGHGPQRRQPSRFALLLGCPFSRGPSRSPLVPPGTLRAILRATGPHPGGCPQQSDFIFPPSRASEWSKYGVALPNSGGAPGGSFADAPHRLGRSSHLTRGSGGLSFRLVGVFSATRPGALGPGHPGANRPPG